MLAHTNAPPPPSAAALDGPGWDIVTGYFIEDLRFTLDGLIDRMDRVRGLLRPNKGATP